jgi:tetratricopeptide (TPR) repeat protein
VDDLAVTHNQLGEIYRMANDLDRALPHYREAIRYDEMQGNAFGAGGTRYNVALALGGAGRLVDALAYARAALRNYQSYGQRAADRVERARRLIAQIEGEMRG